jgi:hypothetical protein
MPADAQRVARMAEAGTGAFVVSASGPPVFGNPSPAVPATREPLASLVVDAEEDFDWREPIAGTAYSTACMRNLGDLQSIAGAWKIQPTYLLTYPVLQDPLAVSALRRYWERGECVLGLQLHTWVTPPVQTRLGIGGSFAANLPPLVEEEKLVTLKRAFVAQFGFDPVLFRSGRYALSPATPGLLEKHGFELDASLAPRTTLAPEGGPDCSALDCAPFWFGERRRLLELPLCRSIVGWGGRVASAVYLKFARPPFARVGVGPLLARTRAAERITLSPEGNDAAAMRRLVRSLLARQIRVLPVSFHSSSCAVGLNPYVRSRADLHRFYDRLSAVLAYLAEDAGCRFASMAEIPALMRPAAAP